MVVTFTNLHIVTSVSHVSGYKPWQKYDAPSVVEEPFLSTAFGHLFLLLFLDLWRL